MWRARRGTRPRRTRADAWTRTPRTFRLQERGHGSVWLVTAGQADHTLVCAGRGACRSQSFRDSLGDRLSIVDRLGRLGNSCQGAGTLLLMTVPTQRAAHNRSRATRDDRFSLSRSPPTAPQIVTAGDDGTARIRDRWPRSDTPPPPWRIRRRGAVERFSATSSCTACDTPTPARTLQGSIVSIDGAN